MSHRFHRRSRLLAVGLCLAAAVSSVGQAQVGDGSPDPHLSLKDRQAMRFPQPVRVGDLRGEHVIMPGPRLRQVGTVVGVFRSGDDDLALVFRYGGLFGLGARTIAPDLDDVDLVGPLVKIVDLDCKDLNAMPTFKAVGGAFLGPNEIIRLGVDRKS